MKISLIRFLGTARFHTARLPDLQTTRVIRLRPHSSTSYPGCPMFIGSHLALDPAFHDPGPGQRIRRHHPTKRSPRHLPTSTAVQPVPPGARCRIVHQVEAWAVAPYAVILVVPPQLCTPSRVLFLERTVAVVPAPTPERAQAAAEPLALCLPFDGVAASPGLAPVVDKTQKAASPGLAIG